MKKTVMTKVASTAVIAGMVALAVGNVPQPPVAHANVADTVKDGVKGIINKIKEFKDTAGHWAQSAINLAVEKGYVDGFQDGNFHPDEKLTRAQFLKMVMTATNTSVGSASGGAWYTPYVDAATNAGIISSSDFSDQNWDAPMTRLEMAKVAVRAAGIQNSDDKKWMYLATKAGLVQGTDDTGSLSMEKTTTRAESVTIIERVLSVKNGQQLLVDKHAVSRAEIEWHGTNVSTMWPRYFPEKFAEKFDISKGQWDSPDGRYHEKLLEYIVVDMEDPNDPFRSEVKGMKFTFRGVDSSGKPTKPKTYSAPSKSYVAFSKVSQKLTDTYPAGWYGSEGGYVDILGGGFGPDQDSNSWLKKYSAQENESTVLFTKNQVSQNVVDISAARGNPHDQHQYEIGKEYYWYQANLFPKGDMFTSARIEIAFTPNLYYWQESGSKGNMMEFSLVSSYPDYSVTNP
jgi:hypothetical protein